MQIAPFKTTPFDNLVILEGVCFNKKCKSGKDQKGVPNQKAAQWSIRLSKPDHEKLISAKTSEELPERLTPVQRGYILTGLCDECQKSHK